VEFKDAPLGPALRHTALLGLSLAAAALLGGEILGGTSPAPEAVVPVRPSATAGPPIEIVAASFTQHSPVGKPLPVVFALRNRTSGAIVVLPSLDASDVGWRYPMITIEVRDVDGNLVEPKNLGRCGLVNPLTAKDFATVPTGASIDIVGEGTSGHHMNRWVPEVPGPYSVTMIYDIRFDSPETKTAVPDDDDEVARLIAALPRGIYRSNSVTIQVTGF
jgi:hypothetical protein